MTTSSLTADVVLELALGRHALFSKRAADGALLQALSTRQRTLLLRYGGAVDGLVNATVELATVISGVLVGQEDGVPVYGTTFADGWPMHQTDDGVPYVDFTEAPIAGDPFGENGGTPGFPLPADFLKLNPPATAVTTDGRMLPIDIVTESARHTRLRSPSLTAFVSGNRLVPVRALASGNSGDLWSTSVRSIQLSYVVLPVLTALTDLVTLPAVLHEPLIAGIAELLAASTPGMSANERAGFALAARTAEETITNFSVDVVGASSSVRYRG